MSDGSVVMLLKTAPCHEPVVTMRNASKWYGLVVVYPDGKTVEHDFGQLEPFTEHSAYRDHVPNPAAVQRWADSGGYLVDQRALEMMLGRWLIESNDDDLADVLARFEK